MKFRLKITFSMICLVAILFGAGGTILIAKSFDDALEREIRTDLNSYRMVLRTLLVINDSASWTSKNDITKVIQQLTDMSGSQSAIRLSSSNETFYESGSLTQWFQDLKDQTSSINLVYEVFTPTEVQSSVLHPQSNYYLQICGTFSAGLESMYLDIAYDLSEIYTTRIRQQEIYFRIFLILIAACAIFSYLVAYLLTKSLNRLSLTSRKIASGDFSCRSCLNSSDEIGQLSKDFDSMADRLVEHMEELNAAMERQNQFVGNFTHELKTPMTSIIGYADLLRGHTLSSEEAGEAANYIFSEGKRMERLSMKLLDIFVAEKRDYTFRPASPSEIIRYTVSHLTDDYLQHGIHFECTLEPGICLLETDFFTSLIKNIIENARRAMPEGGIIRIYQRMTESGCELIIQDNGRGIPQEALSHLTEAFYRVDKSRSRAQGGAGLGLALCMEIARMHHGTMRFVSKLGEGTAVTVSINANSLSSQQD